MAGLNDAETMRSMLMNTKDRVRSLEQQLAAAQKEHAELFIAYERAKFPPAPEMTEVQKRAMRRFCAVKWQEIP